MVRRFFLLVIILSLYFIEHIYSQEKKDLGIQVGASYYTGDYNQSKILYQPLPAIGIIFRYNLNNYYSLRASASYGGLSGNYSSFNHYLPGTTNSFTKQIIEAEILGEANFLTFNTRNAKKNIFSPYVVFGFGSAYIGGEVIPNIPFGVGLKYCPIPRLTVGFEWRLHKTFSDNIDNYQNVFDGSKAIFHNNDWFSFMGLFITFRLYNYDKICPVYK
ncbi:MAG: DUF6089 family protein [Tenuifilaceae bacterium]